MWHPHIWDKGILKAAQIVTIEKCVRTLLVHLSQLSYENSSGCAAVNLRNTINYNLIFENKMKNKILPDLNQCRKVSYNLWTNWTVWGGPLQFSILLHEPLSPPRPKSGANEMQNWDGPHSSWAEIKSKPVLNRQRFCSPSAFIGSKDELDVLQCSAILIFCSP